jgi:MoxR-like ATPase
VLTTDALVALQAAADAVYVDPALYDYAVRLAVATRVPDRLGMPELTRFITYGASPRASINLILAGKALAFLRGRPYVLPDDVLDMAADVIRHRLVLSYEALAEGVTPDAILATILARVPAPTVPLREHAALAARA